VRSSLCWQNFDRAISISYAFEALAPKLSSHGFKILLDIVATAGDQLRTVEIPYVFRDRMHVRLEKPLTPEAIK